MQLKMNLGEDENFVFKHPYFFDNGTFKFEGLKPAIRNAFENTVKSMGATVSDDAKHVLTDIQCLPSLDKKINYYSITYLSESILAEKSLEIEDFKFTNLIESSDESKICCFKAKCVYRKSCISYVNQNICCKLCMEERGLDKLLKDYNDQVNGETDAPNVSNFNEGSQHSNIDILNEEVNGLQIEEPIEIMNNLSFEINDVNLDKNSDDPTIQPLSNGVTQENEASKNDSDSSDIELIGIQTNNDLEKPSCSTQVPNSLKENGKSTIDRWKKNRIISSDSDTSSKNDYISCLKQRSTIWKTNGQSATNKHKRIKKFSSSSDSSIKSADIREETSCRPTKKRQRLSSSPRSEAVTNKSSDGEFIDESEESSSSKKQNFVIRENKTKKDWWSELPPPKELNTARGFSRKRDYEPIERRLMITYLIQKRMIDDGTSRKPWQEFLDDGYLKHRTVESLNNHYRRKLLPNIETYKLPAHIEKQFVDCRKVHIRRK